MDDNFVVMNNVDTLTRMNLDLLASSLASQLYLYYRKEEIEYFLSLLNGKLELDKMSDSNDLNKRSNIYHIVQSLER